MTKRTDRHNLKWPQKILLDKLAEDCYAYLVDRKAIVEELSSKIIRQELLFLCLITYTVALTMLLMQPIPN